MEDSYDIIVVGFGTAGSIAAISAGRQGATVLVLEALTYPGGTFTGGGVPGFYGRHPYGLTLQLSTEAKTYMRLHGCSNIEASKAIFESEALQANCRIIYEATVYEVLRDGNRVTGVKWSDADGLHEAEAKFVIDATGDARICRMAGCETTLGRKSDGRCNSFTNSMIAVKSPDAFVQNFDAGRINQYLPEEYSRVMLESTLDHLKDDYTIGLDEMHQAAPSDICGLREGCHILSEEYQTLEEFFDGKYDNSADAITFAHSNIDIHASDMPLESTIFQDWMIGASMWGTELWFPVLRGALVPRGYKGLLAAGRHIGVDHDLGQAVRMNDHVGSIGEAVGIIAAISAKKGMDAMALPFEEISSRMEQRGNLLDENSKVWGLSLEEIHAGLESDAPGFAIWSARRQKCVSQLIQWYEGAADKSNLQCNAAFALALLGNSVSLPLLRRLAEERDEYAPSTSRKYNHKRGYVSVYLLGRLADAGAVSLLKSILTDRDIANKYEYYGHAVAALIKISDAHPETSGDIYPFLITLAEDPDWQFTSRLKGTQTYRRIDQIFREFIRRQTGVEKGVNIVKFNCNFHRKAVH